VFQGQLSVEKELFAESLSNFKFPTIKVTHTNVPLENDWHTKGRILASKLYSSQKQLSVVDVLVVLIMPWNRGGGGGRFCVTDDKAAVTIVANVQVRAEHVTALITTKKKESSDETRKGHRRHLKKMILWWMAEYPEYFEGTCVLFAEEKADPMKFYHTCDRDIVCEGLCVDMVLSYMAATKKKGDVTNRDKVYCYDHLQRIHDAVLFGARRVKQVLSSSCYSEMNSFLASF
jgi:hypothetical protein